MRPMTGEGMLDALVVGSGPNGLAAAITLARAGRSVRVLEAAPEPGGGARTTELTLPGYRHDVCAAVHPLAAASPFFAGLDLAARGARLIHPELPVAHPLPGGRSGRLWQSMDRTAADLGDDGPAWRWLVGRVAQRWDRWAPAVLRPVLSLPSHPLDLARFGTRAVLPATTVARMFRTPQARALVAGLAAHSFLPLEHAFTSSFALLLGAAAHTVGWPIVAGGSGRLVEAMVSELEALGGEVVCDHRVRSMADLAGARVALFDLAPAQVLRIAAGALPAATRRRYQRYRTGPGVFKVDYALSDPIPWTDPACHGAGTVHVGGTIEEVAEAERAVAAGRHPERPFVLVAQQSRFDPSRSPGGGHTLWAYCHVPNGSPVDMSERIERQIERFAPAFSDTIVARHRAGPAWFERYNENDAGGDISGGSHAGTQLLLRPGWTWHPYRTGNPDLYLCSASTPPGGGVHGMCGYNAALDVLGSRLA